MRRRCNENVRIIYRNGVIMIKDKRTIQGILNEMASLGFHSILVDGNGWTTCKRKNKSGMKLIIKRMN